MTNQENVIEVEHLRTELGGHLVHKDINLSVRRGEIIGVVGGSGSGKTTLMRQMLGLMHPASGAIRVFGQDINKSTPEQLLAIQRRWGVLFQENALFSSFTLLENVSFPLKEHTSLDPESIRELAMLKILMTGLPADAAGKLPAELSGGMQKRAGIARALVLDPELIFLDEPTSGLDPYTADAFDELVLQLQSTMGLTIVIITHDLDSLWKIATRVAFLGKGQVVCVDTMDRLIKNENPMIQQFFNGPRGKAARHILNSRSDSEKRDEHGH